MRLDVYLFEKGHVGSRTDAKNLILAGAVSLNGKIITKPAYDVPDEVDPDVCVDKRTKKYVSRGGLKLEAALDNFNVQVLGRCALDVGASSGGFTDCLLKRGVERVIAVDSGSGQLVRELKEDPRVDSIESFNARYMTRDDLSFIPDLAVMDVSFISATHIIPSVFKCLSDGGDFICLVKPQFEVGRSNIGKGGIVKSEKARNAALNAVIAFSESIGFKLCATMRSPIEGGDGNIEFLIHLKKPSTVG